MNSLNTKVVQEILIEINQPKNKIVLITPSIEYHLDFTKQNPFLSEISDEEFNQKIDEILSIIEENKITAKINRKIKPKEANEIHYCIDRI